MEQKFKVSGMTCAACSAGIQKTVGKMSGVHKAEVSLMGECMTVDYDESVIDAEKIIDAVVSLGYGAEADDGKASAKAAEGGKQALSGHAAEARKLRTRFIASLCFLLPPSSVLRMR